MLNKKKNNKGFTLVELLVVIAIIGILAVVAIPALFSNINKAKATDIMSDARAIKTAVMSQYADGDLSDGTVTDFTNLEIEDLSDEATYSLVTSGVKTSGAKSILTVTTNNPSIAERIVSEWGNGSSSVDNVVTITVFDASFEPTPGK